MFLSQIGLDSYTFFSSKVSLIDCTLFFEIKPAVDVSIMYMYSNANDKDI